MAKIKKKPKQDTSNCFVFNAINEDKGDDEEDDVFESDSRVELFTDTHGKLTDGLYINIEVNGDIVDFFVDQANALKFVDKLCERIKDKWPNS